MTARQLAREFRIAEHRRRDEIERDKALAYHIGLLTRVKRFPSPESWLGRPVPRRKKTVEEMKQVVLLAAALYGGTVTTRAEREAAAANAAAKAKT